MFVPLSTDAPIYYRPWGTMGLIALNLLAFILSRGGSEEVLEALALVHGKGLHPLQWITSNFLHYGYFHLAGNMLFLWGFGLVVEGKIGPFLFVPVYFGIGALECALEQAIFPGPGYSFGASAIIYGLMVMALLWAPRNEMTIGWWFILRGGVFDMSILWFAMLLILESVAFALMLGLDQSSETLHLMGGLVGGAVGLAMLFTRTVDCEGWDLISVMKGTTPDASRFVKRAGAPTFGKRKAKRARRSQTDSDHSVKSSTLIEKPGPHRFEQLVAAGKVTAAYAELQKIRRSRPNWRPQASALRTLARGLRRHRQFDAALNCGLEYLQEIGFQDPAAILDAAEILVVVKTRPRAAMKLLDHIDSGQLSAELLKRCQKVQAAARKIIDSGILELEENLGI